jgi:hypothetical protein
MSIKEFIFWLIFICIATSVGFWFFNLTKEKNFDSNDFVYSEKTQNNNSLDGLEIKIPENESIIVKLNKKKISPDKERYVAEFNQPLEGEEFPLRGSVVIVDEIKFEDDKYQVMPMAVNFGGSGEFIYLVLLKKTSDGLEHVDSLAIGDRIHYESFSMEEPQVVFNYMSHHSSQAMVEEPNVSTHLYFEILNDKFVEGIKYFNTLPTDIVITKPNSDVETIFVINFKAKGWLFEDSSLVRLVSEGYENIFETQAKSVDGEWMKSGLVDIKAQLNAGTHKGKTKVIIEGDNPSGLPENDKKVEFWVYIK